MKGLAGGRDLESELGMIQQSLGAYYNATLQDSHLLRAIIHLEGALA